MFRRLEHLPGEGARNIPDREHAYERTMNRAVKLLAAKPRSVKELRERLLEKPWTDHAIVEAVTDKLRDYKYLDDEQYARDIAISQLKQKPQGRRRLQQTMSRKKLDKEVVESSISEAFEKLPEGDLLELVIEKRLRLKGRPETREDAKKFYDHLMRQGFGYDLISEKMGAIARRAVQDDDD